MCGMEGEGREGRMGRGEMGGCRTATRAKLAGAEHAEGAGGGSCNAMSWWVLELQDPGPRSGSSSSSISSIQGRPSWHEWRPAEPDRTARAQSSAADVGLCLMPPPWPDPARSARLIRQVPTQMATSSCQLHAHAFASRSS